MAKKRKQPEFTHCKVVLTSHPKAPWRVSYPVEDNGITRRKRRMFSTEQKAMSFALEHEREVSDHGVRFGGITAEARRAFDYFRDARADLAGDGIEVPTFEKFVMDGVAALRTAHAAAQHTRKPAAEAVAEFLAYKSTRVGQSHKEGLKSQLTRFSKTFGTDHLDEITAAQIESWLGGISTFGPVTRNKMRKSLKTFFRYGMSPERGWCQRNPLADIEPEKVKTPEPEAYTPEQTARILQAALDMDSPALPALALGFFAGLRPSETEKIDLGTIDLDLDEFRVPAGTKTGARIAPLTPACKAWLAAQTRRTGKAWSSHRQGLVIAAGAVLASAKVSVIFDGARHSFITHRTAAIRDAAQVADECGNSANIIRKHYRQIVNSEAAKKYFAIRPEKRGRKSKITNIETGRKSA